MLGADNQIAALEKEVKELRTKTADKQPEEQNGMGMGGPLGGRLMIGGPA